MIRSTYNGLLFDQPCDIGTMCYARAYIHETYLFFGRMISLGHRNCIYVYLLKRSYTYFLHLIGKQTMHVGFRLNAKSPMGYDAKGQHSIYSNWRYMDSGCNWPDENPLKIVQRRKNVVIEK